MLSRLISVSSYVEPSLLHEFQKDFLTFRIDLCKYFSSTSFHSLLQSRQKKPFQKNASGNRVNRIKEKVDAGFLLAFLVSFPSSLHFCVFHYQHLLILWATIFEVVFISSRLHLHQKTEFHRRFPHCAEGYWHFMESNSVLNIYFDDQNKLKPEHYSFQSWNVWWH